MKGFERMKEMNHGHTRPRCANACALWDKGERKRSQPVLVCGSKQIGVRSGVGKGENQFARGCVKVEKNPIVLDVAIAKSLKVAGKRMISILRRQNLSPCKLKAKLQLFRGADVHERVANGEDFDHALLHAVVDPVAVMVAEDLTDLRTVEFWECLAPELRVVGELRRGASGISIELYRVVKVEIVGDVVECRLKPLEATFCPDKFHTATFFCCFAACLAMCFSIMCSTSLAVYTSPLSASPSATRRSSYASIFSSFSWISSHVEAFTNTPAVRPFCVTMIGRPVSRVCVMYPASPARNSLSGSMSSFALKLYMACSLLGVGMNIVQDSVCPVKEAA